MPPRCVLLVLVATCVSPSIGGKKKTGGVPIFDARKSKGEHISHTAAEHAELVKFLTMARHSHHGATLGPGDADGALGDASNAWEVNSLQLRQLRRGL